MRKLLLVTGDLATGKSTFTAILSNRYDTIAFFKDSIKEVLGDTIGFSNREENKKLSVATAELMCHIFSEFAKRKQNLILEANFHTAELQKLYEIALANHYEVLTIVLRGDVKILHERYLNRMQNENRHPVHLSTTFDVFDDFKAYIEHSRTEQVLGNTQYINAADFAYQTDIDILGKIDEFMRT